MPKGLLHRHREDELHSRKPTCTKEPASACFQTLQEDPGSLHAPRSQRLPASKPYKKIQKGVWISALFVSAPELIVIIHFLSREREKRTHS